MPTFRCGPGIQSPASGILPRPQMTTGTTPPRAFLALKKIFPSRPGLLVRRCVTGVVLLLRMLSPHVPAPLAVVALCSAVVSGATTTVTAPAEKRTFNLPRGDAADTLKHFAAAAGTPIVYLVDRVRGATTNAVSGEFTPRDALERMLTGSALEAAQDAATGALVVSRKRTVEATPRTGEAEPVSDQQPKPKSMKSPRTLFAVILGLIVGPNSATLAADAITGAIEGRVFGASSSSYLERVRVTVENTAQETLTDADGVYRFTAVPAGTARLRLSVTLAHDEADLDRAAEAVIRAFREETQP